MQRDTAEPGRPPGMVLDQTRIDNEVRTGNWKNQILTDYFGDVLHENPDQVAIIAYRQEDGAEITLSYSDLDNYASRIAGNLAALGVVKGDIISFQLPNWWQFVALYIACLKIGAISNPLMPIFRTHELEYMVGFAESKVLIVPKFFQKCDHEALGNAVKQKVPTLDHVFVIGGEGPNAFENALLKDNTETAPHISPLSPNDVVQILYTSGTTGRPKGVMHTSNTLLASAAQVAERLQLDSSSIGFMPAPFAHQIGFCFGVVTSIMLGIPLVMMDVWNAETAAELIESHRATYTCGSTPFMADLANVPDIDTFDIDSLNMFMTAGAPVIESIVEKTTRVLNVKVVPGWGMTEVIQATATEPITTLDAPLTDGAAFAGNEVRIVSDDGEVLPVGQEGNLQCRGSTLFVGYLKKPELYDVDAEGWFNTGDLARMDERDNIKIVGRSKDIIIRGGENVPVHEVEALIHEMSGIRDVALVSMPDERLGERGCVFLTMTEMQNLTLNELTIFLEQHNLARQYFPERLEIIDEMPRTASGKIQKFVLRERAKQFSANALPVARNA